MYRHVPSVKSTVSARTPLPATVVEPLTASHRMCLAYMSGQCMEAGEPLFTPHPP